MLRRSFVKLTVVATNTGQRHLASWSTISMRSAADYKASRDISKLSSPHPQKTQSSSEPRLRTHTILQHRTAAFLLLTAILAVLASVFLRKALPQQESTPTSIITSDYMSAAARTTKMAQILKNAKLAPLRSNKRGHNNHGWLDTYHTFSFADYYNPKYTQFGSIRVLNEDRVAPGTGFPTHPHRNAEIFSYILSGELTHRDSMMGAKGGEKAASKEDFYRMKRGDVQFTTGGKGIAHSEQNEHTKDWVHFLQIWVMPWKHGLPPVYHTSTFAEETKKNAFVTIISPLKGGVEATAEQEKAAEPVVAGSIPIHADVLMGASIVEPGKTVTWTVGSAANGVVNKTTSRNVLVHLPITKGGKSKLMINGDDATVLSEGDGMFITDVDAGQGLVFESVGVADAEFVVLDSD